MTILTREGVKCGPCPQAWSAFYLQPPCPTLPSNYEGLSQARHFYRTIWETNRSAISACHFVSVQTCTVSSTSYQTNKSGTQPYTHLYTQSRN